MRGALRLRLSVMVAMVVWGCVGADSPYSLEVGNDAPPDGGGSSAPGATATGQTLGVTIAEQPPNGCAQPCVELTAHASGGVPPYSYQWNPPVAADGGVAEVCATATATYAVTVTDSAAVGGEFPLPRGSASAMTTVNPPGASCAADGGIEDAAASIVYWADWQSVDAGAVSGTLSPPSGSIQVVYSGDLYGAQTTNGDDDFVPSTTFTSPTVSDPPPGPGMIEVAGGSAQTDSLTFSEPVTNPVIAIYGLGTAISGASASLVFNAPCTVLASGLNGVSGYRWWGSETLTPVDGGVSGVDSNGLVELEGTFGAIQWTNPGDTPALGFTGITVGIRVQRAEGDH